MHTRERNRLRKHSERMYVYTSAHRLSTTIKKTKTTVKRTRKVWFIQRKKKSPQKLSLKKIYMTEALKQSS
jgi:hypothetical protein